MTDLLLESELSPDQTDLAQTVRRSAEALLQIINDLLDLSKIEAGKLTLENIPFSPRTELEDVLELLAVQAESKQLELIGKVEPDVPDCVVGDPGRFRQVLMNLVGNGIKFTSQGQVLVSLEVSGSNDQQITLQCAVADTGIGISLQNQEAIFEPFVQEDGSTTRRFGGTGLGLAICRRIVHQMGGKIGVRSTPNVGSTFTFSVPFERAANVPFLRDGNPMLLGLRVLIVDDYVDNRKVLREMVHSWGMIASEASDASEAWLCLRASVEAGPSYSVVLLDMQMPGVSGLELARQIRRDQRLANLPLVLLTSLGQRRICRSLQQAGIAACLSKPIRQASLFLTLSQVLAIQANPQSVATGFRHKSLFDGSHASMASRILVAEDNIINQKVISRLLSKFGYAHDIVTDGEQAVNCVRRGGYKVVLMDCRCL